MSENKEVLLKVDHLSQYFGPVKAVDDVSFEIMKGEVFGLVGESGCGKTTTGRSIIRIYDITGGDIYFKGEKIAAGSDIYRIQVKNAKNNLKEMTKRLNADSKLNPSKKNENDARIK